MKENQMQTEGTVMKHTSTLKTHINTCIKIAGKTAK